MKNKSKHSRKGTEPEKLQVGGTRVALSLRQLLSSLREVGEMGNLAASWVEEEHLGNRYGPRTNIGEARLSNTS